MDDRLVYLFLFSNSVSNEYLPTTVSRDMAQQVVNLSGFGVDRIFVLDRTKIRSKHIQREAVYSHLKKCYEIMWSINE